MNKIFSFILFFCLPAIAANAQPKTEKEVASAVTFLYKAMIDADKNSLENLAADELSYGHSSGKVDDKKAFVEGVTKGSFDFLTIDISDQIIKLVGKTAIVRHTFSSGVLNNGNPDSLKLAILLVWKKQKGNWKLLARQAVKL